MLNSGPRDGEGGDDSRIGAKGSVQLGCLAFEQLPCYVIVGGKTIPKEYLTCFAILIPNLAMVTAEYRDCLKSASCLMGVDLEFSLACSKVIPARFWTNVRKEIQSVYRSRIRTLRIREGSTHFGSIKS